MTLAHESADGDRVADDRAALQQQLDEAQALAHLGSWEWSVATHRVRWSNELYRIYGLDPSAFTASFEAYLERVHPDDRERVRQIIGATVEDGGAFDFEERIVRPDGEVRWLRSRGRATETDGHVARLVGTCQDITERKEAEARERRQLGERIAREEAERSRAALQRIFEQAPAAIAVVRGPDLVFETVSRAYVELLGSTALLGQPLRVLETVSGEGAGARVRLIERVYREGERFVGRELRIVRPSPAGAPAPDRATIRWVDAVYEPLRDAEGETEGVVIHLVDVTEKVEARDALAALASRLQASNEELEQFAYVASHDLRAPLRGIANLAEWIEEDSGEALSAASREHLTLLRGRAARLDRLIDGILQYSRATRRRFDAERVDVRDLLAEACDLLGAAPDQITYVGEPLVIQTERVPLQQLVQNLLSNALTHGGARPQVTVSARRSDDALELAVSDDGPGIEPRYHDRIFGMFQTLRSRDEVEGAGVGLAIVRKLAEARGGRATVESEAGRGATFRVTWPVEADAS